MQFFVSIKDFVLAHPGALSFAVWAIVSEIMALSPKCKSNGVLDFIKNKAKAIADKSLDNPAA